MPELYGAYGKIPALGDFFRINLPPGFIQPWDEWLQSGLLSARKTLGDRWDICFNTAPIWRFTASANLAGDFPVFGVMMCSVDRVGRQFPLTLACPLPEGSCPVQAHLSGLPQFEALEAIALDALDDDMTRDALAERLSAVPELASLEHSKIVKTSTGIWITSDTETNMRDTLAASYLKSQYQPVSVWSVQVNETERLLCREGLPPAEQMHEFFDPAFLPGDEGEDG